MAHYSKKVLKKASESPCYMTKETSKKWEEEGPREFNFLPWANRPFYGSETPSDFNLALFPKEDWKSE